jgi:hypothetical protein
LKRLPEQLALRTVLRGQQRAPQHGGAAQSARAYLCGQRRHADDPLGDPYGEFIAPGLADLAAEDHAPGVQQRDHGRDTEGETVGEGVEEAVG